ncbi:MAG: FtsX-like permease family protein [Acidimicrobiales bacterium]|nr:FtsX-like permease family protein [Acidimicrobiales bacterium]
MKVRYLLRETGANLWRNISLTIAAVFAVGVSLTLFGTARMFSDGVENATKRWEGGIEFVVWMNPDATPEQDAAIRETLQTSPQIKESKYVDQDAAYIEFQELFADTPELLDAVLPEDLPPSYRVVPTNPDALVVEELGSRFEERAGVRDVVFATDTIQEIQSTFNRVSFWFLAGSLVLLVVALLLILNTIIMAINGRRREIEVMKLVGASNWYVRLPFMLEGLLQGLLGAALAVGGAMAIRRAVIDKFASSEKIRLFEGFTISDGQFYSVATLLIAIGVGIAVLGSGVAVSRHLDV